MFEVVRAIIALLVLYILPGYTLLRAFFPRPGTFSSQYDIIYRFTLGVVVSIIMSLLVAFSLGTIGFNDGPISYKTPYILMIHLSLITIFFLVGWERGAYPWMAIINPKLFRVAPPTVVSSALSKNRDLMREIERLSLRRHRLQEEIEACGKRALTYDMELAQHHQQQREHLKKELDKVLARLEELDVERKQVKMV